uniref:Ovule protein n=1 Tax=Rhabditophanes sp. KR3021 TaxID=114890 RepID=A0AC35U4C7_9BILA
MVRIRQMIDPVNVQEVGIEHQTTDIDICLPIEEVVNINEEDTMEVEEWEEIPNGDIVVENGDVVAENEEIMEEVPISTLVLPVEEYSRDDSRTKESGGSLDRMNVSVNGTRARRVQNNKTVGDVGAIGAPITTRTPIGRAVMRRRPDADSARVPYICRMNAMSAGLSVGRLIP